MTESAPRPAERPGPVVLRELGRMAYGEALAIQLDEAGRVERGEREGALLLVEHPPVLTVGRRAAPGELGLGVEEWRRRGVEVCETNRGGRVTYHGPGQLVAYPILALRRLGLDVTRHVRLLEQTAIAMLASYGIEGFRDPENPGVWVRSGAGRLVKVAALGVHVKRWVTTHGIAVNVALDTSIYQEFNPCGLGGRRGVASIAELAGRPVDMAEARGRFVECFVSSFGLQLFEDANGACAE